MIESKVEKVVTSPGGPKPYYNQILTKERAAAMLGQVHAQLVPTRGKPGVRVYTVAGGGEAMVTGLADGTMRVELFRGKCPC